MSHKHQDRCSQLDFGLGAGFFPFCCFLPYFIAVCWKGSRFSKVVACFSEPMDWRMLVFETICVSPAVYVEVEEMTPSGFYLIAALAPGALLM